MKLPSVLARRLSAESIARDVLAIATGTAAAQLLSIIATPLVTRLFGPHAFGLYGVFMAIVSFVAPLATLSYASAIVLPKDASEARALARLSVTIGLIISLAAALALLLASGAIEAALKFPVANLLIWVLPITILSSAYLQVLQGYKTRSRQFNAAAKVSFLHSMILNGTKVMLGFLIPNGSVLVIVSAAGITLNAAMLQLGQKLDFVTSTRPLFEVARRYRDFPLYVTPDSLLGAAMRGGPVIALAAYADPSYAGFYALTNTVVRLPGTLISASIRDAIYPRLADAYNNGCSMYPLLVKSTAAVAGATCLPFLFLAMLGPWLFSFAFGPDWTVAGEFARWAAIAMFFSFVDAPGSRANAVLKRQGFAFAVRVIAVAVSFALLISILHLGGSPVQAVAVFSIARAASYAFLTFSVIMAAKSAPNNSSSHQ